MTKEENNKVEVDEEDASEEKIYNLSVIADQISMFRDKLEDDDIKSNISNYISVKTLARNRVL